MYDIAGLLKRNNKLIMGILNVTPDSFYDGGKYFDANSAVDHSIEMINSGADIIDIGGESTRPGSEPVPAQEQINRIIPVLKKIRELSDVCISIDTTSSKVAESALNEGADIINDVSGLRFDARMPEVVLKYNSGIIIMHMLGEPATMQVNPYYERGVVEEISDFFQERLTFCKRFGIPHDRMIIDPGIGFGKTTEHNLDIISNCADFKKFNSPLLIGTSNKRFISAIMGDSMEDRLFGTVATVAYAMLNGADIFRVHNVGQIKKIMVMLNEIMKRNKEDDDS